MGADTEPKRCRPLSQNRGIDLTRHSLPTPRDGHRPPWSSVLIILGLLAAAGTLALPPAFTGLSLLALILAVAAVAVRFVEYRRNLS